MAKNKNIFKVEVACDYPQWWRYNIFMTIAGYDEAGQLVSYRSKSDKVYEIGADTDGRTGPPPGYKTPRNIEIESEPCQWIEVYFYAIANTFPESSHIKDSPPFPLTLSVSLSGKQLEKSVYQVNQWGGISIAGLKVTANE